MPALLDLSNELLFKIIDQIHPDDIPNFSLTCKDIHQVAKDAVQFHLDREETYEDVVLHGCHRHEDNDHPLELIKEICMDWRIGEYVKTLTVNCCGLPLEKLHHGIEDQEDAQKYKVEKLEDSITNRSTMQVIQGYIKEKAVECALSTPFDVTSLCCEAARGERGAMLTLLLLFTPNLKSIKLYNFGWSENLKEGLFAISEQNVQRSPDARKLLMDLEYVGLEGVPDGGGAELIDPLVWFAVLPSMKALLGNWVCGWGTEALTLPPNISNLKSITLLDSTVSGSLVEQMLIGIKSLKDFFYDHNHNIFLDGMQAHRIVASLHQHAKHSLKYLTLSGLCDLRVESDDTIDRCLHEFEVLKEVYMSYSFYVEMLPWHGTHEGRRIREDIQPLVYALPPSVEKVGVTRFKSFGCDSALLVDFTEEKDRRLPNLKEIMIDCTTIEGGEEGWPKLVEACEKVGVKLKIRFDRDWL